MTIDELLADFPPSVQFLAADLRRLIADALPEAGEKVNPGWRSISFRHAHAGYVCGLFPQPDGVAVVFEWGVLLPDPHGVLAGTGRRVRQINLKSGDTVPAEAIADLLAAAVALPKAARELAR